MPMKAQPEGTSREKLEEQVVDVATGRTQTTKFTINFTDEELGKVRIGETHRVPKGWDPESAVPGAVSPVDPLKAHMDAMAWLKDEWLKARANGWKPAEKPAQAAPELQEAAAAEGPIVTESGKVLTEEHIQALADEAEAGYEQGADGKMHAVQPAAPIVLEMKPEAEAEEWLADHPQEFSPIPTSLPPAPAGFPASDSELNTEMPPVELTAEVSPSAELPVMEGEPVLTAPPEAIGWSPAEPFAAEKADEAAATEEQAVQPTARAEMSQAMEAESIRVIPAGSPEDPDSAFYQERMQTPVPEEESIPADELEPPGASYVDWLDQTPEEQPGDIFRGEVFPLP